MEPFCIVELEVPRKRLPGLSDRLVAFQVDLFVFDCPPEPFNEYIVQGAAPAVHADGDSEGLQGSGEFSARKTGCPDPS